MPHLEAAGHSLSYERIEGEAGKPVLVFLHEGLGSIRQWREFPAKVCAATGCAGVVYDRYGYGQSEVLAEPRRRYETLMAEPAQIDRLLAEGAEKARAIAKPVMERVRRAIGM